MPRLRALGIAGIAAAALAIAIGARADRAAVPPGPLATSLPGWPLYERLCGPCHGAAGDGRGPAAPWLWPRPRDLTRGAFAWRTTPVGAGPAADDLAATIRWGAAGTAMPGFGARLSTAEIDALVEVIGAFARAGDVGVAASRGHARLGRVTTDAVARGAALWQKDGCASCHGDGGRGDGPAAPSLRDAAGAPRAPFDLTAAPLRRPRPGDGDAEVDQAIADDVVYGLDGLAMPGNAAIGPDDLAALVAFVDSIRARGAGATAAVNAGPLDGAAIAADRAAPIDSGRWPGGGAPDDAALFGGPIAPQGPAPAALAPAEASLSARQCARCHAKQAREWDGTIHAQAASPGLIAQVLVPGVDATMGGIAACQRCHAPLAEQTPDAGDAGDARDGGADARGAAAGTAAAPDTAAGAAARFDEPLRAEGLTCAACHVRAWTRHGPPGVAASLAPTPGYPLVEQRLYERADFCLPCHQLPPRLAVEGRPLLDTYREWLLGPYLRRGVQCQSCHMPNREHTWKGVHDPDTFRQGVRLDAIAGRAADGVVSVRARVTNVGAGHDLPTTSTPAAWLRVELVDGAGRPIAGARAERRIGRDVVYERGAWHQREDSRIPPGDSLELAAAWRDGRVGEAAVARVTIEVHPDDYYEGFYRRQLAGRPAAAERALYEQALARAIAARYVAITRDVPLR